MGGAGEPDLLFDTWLVLLYASHRGAFDFTPMTVLVKSKTDLVVPVSVRRQAGFKAGDRLEFKVSSGIVVIVPKVPTADDEYTEEQRQIIDARLDKAERSPVHGPFNTADEMIAHMKAALRKRAAAQKPSRPR